MCVCVSVCFVTGRIFCSPATHTHTEWVFISVVFQDCILIEFAFFVLCALPLYANMGLFIMHALGGEQNARGKTSRAPAMEESWLAG